MTTVVPFSSNFITRYEDAFTEFVRLGSVASQRAIEGKRSPDEDLKAKRMLLILQALYRATEVWILATGYWDDAGYWVEDAIWE